MSRAPSREARREAQKTATESSNLRPGTRTSRNARSTSERAEGMSRGRVQDRNQAWTAWTGPGRRNEVRPGPRGARDWVATRRRETNSEESLEDRKVWRRPKNHSETRSEASHQYKSEERRRGWPADGRVGVCGPKAQEHESEESKEGGGGAGVGLGEAEGGREK